MEESQLHIPEGWEIVNFGYQNLNLKWNFCLE